MPDSAKPTKIGWSYNKCPADETYTIWLTDSEGDCLPQGWVFDEKDAVSICRAMNRDHLFERAVRALTEITEITKRTGANTSCGNLFYHVNIAMLLLKDIKEVEGE